MKRNTLLTVLVVTMLGLGLAWAPSAAQGSFFDVFFDIDVSDINAPPYPSEAKIVVRGSRDAAATIETEIVSLSLRSASGLPMLPLRMHASDSGGGVGLAGIDSFFDVFHTGVAEDFPAESFFDVFVEIDAPTDKSSPGLHKISYYPADSFFDVFVTIDIPDLGLTRHHIHGEIPVSQGLKFTGVSDGGHAAGDSFFDVFTELSIDGPLDPLKPLVRMTMTAQIVPEPAGLGLLGLAMLALRKRRS